MESNKGRASLTVRYLAALLAPAVIAGVLQVTWPFFQPAPVILYLLAVIFCAWYGGLGPGLLSVVISFLLIDFFFIEPYSFFWFPKQLDLSRVLLFAVVGPFICVMSELMHRERRRAGINLESAKRARFEAEVLRDANFALTKHLSLEMVLETLLERLGKLIPYDSANVMLLEGESEFAVRAIWGYGSFQCAATVRAVSFDAKTHPPLQQLCTTQRSVVVTDTTTDPAWKRVPGTEHIRNWLGVPLIAHSRVIGLYSLDKTEPGFFTSEHVRLAETLAAQAASAIQNAGSFQQSQDYAAELEKRIAERKRAEESLQLFRTLIDQSSDAIEVIDPDTLSFLDCNENAYRTLGYNREEFLSLSVFDIDPVVDRSTMARLDEEMGKLGFATLESIHRRKDGSTFPVEINLKIVRLERDYRLAVVRDITERKLAQEALHTAEKKYRDIFENAVEGIFQSTRDGRVITANPALARMFGFDSLEELIRERADIPRKHYVEPQRREEFKRLLEEHGVVRGFEFQAYRKDGSKIWILEDVRAVRDEHGSVLYHEGTSEDITERKRAETRSAAFANLAQKLSGATTPLDAGQIIAQTAHDLIGWDSCNLDLYDADHDVIHPILNVDTIGGKQADVTPFFSNRKPTARGRRVIDHGPDLIRRKEPFVFDRDAVPFGDISRPSAAIMTVPIRHASRVIGILSIQSYGPIVYDDVAMSDLQALADHCGGALNRIQAEEQLRESEERYRDLVENSRELICTHDLDGLILSANRAATEVLGHDGEDYNGKKNLCEILAPEARDGFKDYLARIRNDGVASGVMLVQTSSGEHRIWEYYNTLRTEGVAAPIVRGMARDITDRKRAEKALRESEERYRELFENAKDATYVHDLSGRYTSVNRAAEKLAGRSREEIVGRRFTDFVPPEQVELVSEHLCRKLVEEGGTTYETEVMARDGRRVPVEVSSHMIYQNGVAVGVQGTARDITERKQADEALRQSEERFSKAFHSSPAALSITVLDDGRLLEVNAAFLRMTGFSREEVIGRTTVELGLWTSHQRRAMAEALRGRGAVENLEIEFQKKSGEIRNGLLSTELIHLGAGPSVLGIAQDVTERNRAAEALQSYPRKLIEAQEAERQHIARELHDQIGQVLTAIRINLQTIGSSCETDESQVLIDQGITIIDSALEQVRNLSFELRPSLLDGLGLVAALRWYSDQYSRGTGIRTKTSTNLPEGQTRLKEELETACFRIVQEALTNVVRHAKAKNVSINLRKLDHKVVLSIKDDGIGFDERSANGGAAAIHLGLRGMKERALALSGTLEIESAPAQGTEIRASFPTDSKED